MGFINELDLMGVQFATLMFCILCFAGILVKRMEND